MERGLDIVGVQLKRNDPKKIPQQFTSVAAGVQLRLKSHLQQRKSKRQTQFDFGRDLQLAVPDKSTEPEPTELDIKAKQRRIQLEKWKTDKENQKKQVAAKKKKPFLLGVYRPPLTYEPPPPLPGTSGRVTRSQTLKEKKSFAPLNAGFNPMKLPNAPKLMFGKKNTKDFKPNIEFNPVPLKRIQTRSQRARAVKPERIPLNYNPAQKKGQDQNKEGKYVRKSLPKKSKITLTIPASSTSSSTDSDESLKRKPVRNNNKINTQKSASTGTTTPKAVIPKSESHSEERLRSPQSTAENPMTPQQEHMESAKKISPCVTLSRGKDNARKEMKMKLEQGLLDENTSGTDDVQCFRRQLSSEIERLTALCNQWEKLSEHLQLPQYVQELVLSAVGQGRLLMSQKLQQFRLLVDQCAAPDSSSTRVTCTDLHGFWDMVFLQIVDVDMKFKALQELQERNWPEDDPANKKKPTVARKAKEAKKLPVVDAKKPAAGASKIREMIAAARRAQKNKNIEVPVQEDKTFEGGFFSVRSPVKTPPAVMTPVKKATLLKTVLSSEALRASASKCRASFAMLQASLISKNVDIEGISPLQQTPKQQLPPIDLEATPGRSILKSAKKPSRRKSAKKSIKTVLFNENNENDDDNVVISIAKEPVNKRESNDVEVNGMNDSKENQSKSVNEKVNHEESSRSVRKTRSRTGNKTESKPLQDINFNIEEVSLAASKTSTRHIKRVSDLIDLETPKSTRRSTRRSVAIISAEIEIDIAKSITETDTPKITRHSSKYTAQLNSELSEVTNGTRKRRSKKSNAT